jgi:hypothetical protein
MADGQGSLSVHPWQGFSLGSFPQERPVVAVMYLYDIKRFFATFIRQSDTTADDRCNMTC